MSWKVWNRLGGLKRVGRFREGWEVWSYLGGLEESEGYEIRSGLGELKEAKNWKNWRKTRVGRIGRVGEKRGLRDLKETEDLDNPPSFLKCFRFLVEPLSSRCTEYYDLFLSFW